MLDSVILLFSFYNFKNRGKRSKFFTRVFLLHLPVLEDQSTEVSRSQGTLECLMRTINGKLKIEVVDGRKTYLREKKEKRNKISW